MTVLTKFAETCKVPMLIELAEPLETDVQQPMTSCQSTAFLAALLTGHSHYSFEVHGRAVHIYEKSVVTDKYDFLNWKLQDFVLPTNVAELKNVLTARLWSTKMGKVTGGLVHGLLPADLLERPLPAKRYMNSSARQILLDVQDIGGGFYNVVVFPKQRDLDGSDIEKALASWQWHSVVPDSESAERQ